MNIFKIGLIIYAIVLITGCSDKTAATDKLNPEVANVGILVKSPTRNIAVNSNFVLPVVISNNGVGTIPSEGKPDGSLRVFVTYHWDYTDGRTAVWDGVRTQLPSDIPKGGTIDVPLSVTAPSQPGTYTLIIDLVQEGALWFRDTGSQTAQMFFKVVQ